MLHFDFIKATVQVAENWEINTVLPVNKGRVNVQYRKVGLIFELKNWLKFVGFAFIIFNRRSGNYQWLPILCQKARSKF